MSWSHLFSRDVSYDLKAEIINEGRPTQTNTHIIRTHNTHTQLVSSVTLTPYGEQEVYDRQGRI